LNLAEVEVFVKAETSEAEISAPTPAPTGMPTAPTAAPTAEPTKEGYIVSSWADLKAVCGSISNGTLVLSDGFEMGTYVKTTETLQGGIDFSGKKFVLIGNGKILDAGGQGRFFYGSGSGSSLEVHGVPMRNGATLVPRTTSSSTSAFGKGGAIFVQNGAKLEIHDSKFFSNGKFTGSGGGFDGGAIYASSNGGYSDSPAASVFVEIYTSIFQGNSGDIGLGGAIYGFVWNGNLDLVIHDSVFTSNDAGAGGAIMFDCDYHGHLKIYTSTFESNHGASVGVSVGSGGAISVASHETNTEVTAEIHSTSFISNFAQEGGAVEAYKAIVVLRSATFQRNYATKGDLISADALSFAVLDNCIIDYDSSSQKDYFVQGSILVRDAVNSARATGLALERGDSTNAFPGFSSGLCPAFTTQTVNWKNPWPEPKYPWGISCSECITGTKRTNDSISQAGEYPFLDWGCQCPAGFFGPECTPCPAGTYVPAASTFTLPSCLACVSCNISNGELRKGCSNASPGYCATCISWRRTSQRLLKCKPRILRKGCSNASPGYYSGFYAGYCVY
jgi:hypothetical protein